MSKVKVTTDLGNVFYVDAGVLMSSPDSVTRPTPPRVTWKRGKMERKLLELLLANKKDLRRDDVFLKDVFAKIGKQLGISGDQVKNKYYALTKSYLKHCTRRSGGSVDEYDIPKNFDLIERLFRNEPRPRTSENGGNGRKPHLPSAPDLEEQLYRREMACLERLSSAMKKLADKYESP